MNPAVVQTTNRLKDCAQLALINQFMNHGHSKTSLEVSMNFVTHPCQAREGTQAHGAGLLITCW